MNLDQKNIIIFESKYQLDRYKASDPSFFENLAVLTDLEILPYDNFSPDPSLLGKRIETLRLLIENEVSFACTASSIIQPLFDKKYIFEKTFELSKDQQIDLSRLTKFLINSGYERADLVIKNGQYAIRGSVIDIFPSNSKLPIRIDLFDDEVISIKYFKNEDQITFKEIDSYKCIAAKGYELTNESIDIFKKNWRNTFQSDGPLFDSILKGKNLDGLEHYLPLFFYERTFFNDYFKNYKIIYINDAKKYLSEYWDLISERYEDFKLDLDRPPLPPEILFNTLDEISSLNSEELILSIQNNIDEIDSKDDYSYERFSITENIAFEIDSKVVHLDHGIGIYRGLKKLNNTECLIIEFDQGDLIYLPVHSMNLLTAYVGMDEIKLDSIRKSKWNQKKQKTFEKAYDFAAELIESEAKRSNYKRSPLEINTEDFQKFIVNFPYELTPDQLKCSNSLINDFNLSKMMDRLICGEVGFGKTEMALRASYISYMNGFQVCLMVPTTILAEQHYETFTKRFSEYDVDIVLLTRNLSTQEKKDVYSKILNQPNLIVIGTHALMNNKLDFNNVGLLIIDEEHKFGVKQKEKIKSLKAQIDVMYLSATPIPRTLNLALTDLKDFSIIASPPHGRKPVETIVSRESKSFHQRSNTS
jgi:transcription-repair coupling factor (superfamily II helicase)